MKSKALALFLVTIFSVVAIPAEAENYIPPDTEETQVQQLQQYVHLIKTAFPFENSKIISQFGFSQNGFQPYTVFEVHGDVLAAVDGNLSVNDKSIILQSNDLKIVYENVVPSLTNNFVNAGEKIGQADGTVNLYLYWRDVPTDFLFYFFPDKSKMVMNGKIEEKEKEKFIENQKEKQSKNNNQSNTTSTSSNLLSYHELLKTRYDSIFDEAGKETNIDPLFLKAVAYVESGLNPGATSPKGAAGIMQIMPETAQKLGVKNIYDPEENIKAGAKYLRMMSDMFNNNMELTLAAYNAGPQAVKQYNGIPPYEETQKFVQAVMNTYENLKKASTK
ncbi:lytic transglycosylase domain-containing protein [Thermoanaerobacter mathranii]|uniref:lytic transglycosylase domain-containing protein n=1 Tax=Thermoanaerobacter mathranii TaxID=583357 RepID=UPI003D6C510A